MARKQFVRTLFQRDGEVSWREPKECLRCRAIFKPKRKKQKFCSDNCRKRTWDKKKILELLVAALNEAIEKLSEQVKEG